MKDKNDGTLEIRGNLMQPQEIKAKKLSKGPNITNLVLVTGRTSPQASWTTGLMFQSRFKSRYHSRTQRRSLVPFMQNHQMFPSFLFAPAVYLKCPHRMEVWPELRSPGKGEAVSFLSTPVRKFFLVFNFNPPCCKASLLPIGLLP